MDETDETDAMVMVGPLGLILIGRGGFDCVTATDMMVLVGPRSLILIGRMRYHMAECNTFHVYAYMASASEGWVLDLVKIDLDGRQEAYQQRCLTNQSLQEQILNKQQYFR